MSHKEQIKQLRFKKGAIIVVMSYGSKTISLVLFRVVIYQPTKNNKTENLVRSDEKMKLTAHTDIQQTDVFDFSVCFIHVFNKIIFLK